jgi:hypothetical protein
MPFTSPLPSLPAGDRRAQPADVANRPAPASWPFGELTQDQLLTRQRQEARMRAGLLRGLPTCFAEIP